MVAPDVLRIGYVISAGGKMCEDPRSKYEPLLHGMGQHVYINVPEIRFLFYFLQRNGSYVLSRL